MKEINFENDQAFENFDENFSEEIKKEKNPFSLSDIFQGVFSAKGKKEEKK